MSPENDYEEAHGPLSLGASRPPFHASRCHDLVDHSDTDPEVLARLEFAAIDGDPVALETAIDAWRKTLDDLGHNTLEETRLQYLRRAQSVWHELRHQPNHPPHKVFAAIEIISLLCGKAW